jgi:hypothetical protein
MINVTGSNKFACNLWVRVVDYSCQIATKPRWFALILPSNVGASWWPPWSRVLDHSMHNFRLAARDTIQYPSYYQYIKQADRVSFIGQICWHQKVQHRKISARNTARLSIAVSTILLVLGTWHAAITGRWRLRPARVAVRAWPDRVQRASPSRTSPCMVSLSRPYGRVHPVSLHCPE